MLKMASVFPIWFPCLRLTTAPLELGSLPAQETGRPNSPLINNFTWSIDSVVLLTFAPLCLQNHLILAAGGPWYGSACSDGYHFIFTLSVFLAPFVSIIPSLLLYQHQSQRSFTFTVELEEAEGSRKESLRFTLWIAVAVELASVVVMTIFQSTNGMGTMPSLPTCPSA